MKIFAALVWREIVERRLVLLASLLLGFVPIVLPWMPGIPTRIAPEEMRAAATIGLGGLFGGLALLILGSTIVARDLSDRRLGFYFSRPIASWSLWLSRVVAALLLVLICVLLIVAPTTVVDAGSWFESIWGNLGEHTWPLMTDAEKSFVMPFLDDWPIDNSTPERWPLAGAVLFGCSIVLLLVVLLHAVSTMVRGRNLWVLGDLAGGLLVLGLAWNAREVLIREQALGALVWAERLFVLSTLVVLIIAGGVQLARGRSDLLRGHRYLSATLWPSLILVMLAFGAGSRWVASSDVEDLERLTHLRAAPGDRWLMAGGPVRHRAGAGSAFLLETDTGRAWRLGSLTASRAWLTFSPDGSAVVWARCESRQPPHCELWILALRDAGSAPRPTGIPIDLRKMRWLPLADDPALAFNDDGTLLAVAEEERVVVYRIESDPGSESAGASSGATVVASVDADLPNAVTFLPGGLVRFHERLAASPSVALESGWMWRTQIQQLDLGTRRLTETGRLPPGLKSVRSPVRDTVFYQRRLPLSFGFYDGEAGQLLTELDPEWDSIAGKGHFLADGRLVFDHWKLGEATFLVFSPDGEELHRIQLSDVQERRFGGELAPGRLLIGLYEESPSSRAPLHQLDVEPLDGWTTYVLDADSGELSPLASGVMPVGKSGISAERLFLADGEVFRWTVSTQRGETGDRRTILSVGS